jgi:hypothetical protein
MRSMSASVPIPRCRNPPKTGQIVCYQTRTYHLLGTEIFDRALTGPVRPVQIGVGYRAKVVRRPCMPVEIRTRHAGLVRINAHQGGKMARIAGRTTSCAALAVLVAYASPGFAQGTKMSDVADELRIAMAGVSVMVTRRAP